MPSRLRQLAAGIAVLQIVDAIASATPQMSMAARLDHLGVPGVLRPVLPVIKVSTSVAVGRLAATLGRRHDVRSVGRLLCRCGWLPWVRG
jgi:hypothetical protein